MPSQATITGKAGPGITATAVVLTPVRSFNLICATEILEVVMEDGTIRTFDVSAQTTWTLTVSGNNYTLTVA